MVLFKRQMRTAKSALWLFKLLMQQTDQCFKKRNSNSQDFKIDNGQFVEEIIKKFFENVDSII